MCGPELAAITHAYEERRIQISLLRSTVVVRLRMIMRSGGKTSGVWATTKRLRPWLKLFVRIMAMLMSLAGLPSSVARVEPDDEHALLCRRATRRCPLLDLNLRAVNETQQRLMLYHKPGGEVRIDHSVQRSVAKICKSQTAGSTPSFANYCTDVITICVIL